MEARTILVWIACLALGGHASQVHDSQVHDQFSALLGPTAGKRCYAAFLFHVEKCAGTTFRRTFAERRDVETFRQGMVIFARRHPSAPLVPHASCSTNASWYREDVSCTWEQLVADLESNPPARGASRAGQSGRRRVFVEIATMGSSSSEHPDGLSRVIAGVQRVRAAWEPRGCEVVLFGLIREPVSHLLAVYNYFVSNKQAREPRRYGSSFSEWFDSPFVHNLESRMILGEPVLRLQAGQGSRVREGEGEGGAERVAGPDGPPALQLGPLMRRMHATTPERVHAAQPRLLEQLRAFDLLAPMDRFDELWFLLADRLGLERLRYRLANSGNFTQVQREIQRASAAPRPRARWRPPPLDPHPPLVHALDERAAERLRRDKLTVDLALYRNVTGSWRRRVEALDAPTRSRMERFVQLMRGVRNEEMAQQRRVVERWEALKLSRQPGGAQGVAQGASQRSVGRREGSALFGRPLWRNASASAFHAGPTVRQRAGREDGLRPLSRGLK